uniref:Uncharacterized protein n=1 Tax=Glossina pallidipes TaxID=7398 RepID=A0A1B0A0Q0_GLOPL
MSAANLMTLAQDAKFADRNYDVNQEPLAKSRALCKLIKNICVAALQTTLLVTLIIVGVLGISLSIFAIVWLVITIICKIMLIKTTHRLFSPYSYLIPIVRENINHGEDCIRSVKCSCSVDMFRINIRNDVFFTKICHTSANSWIATRTFTNT